LGVLRQYQPKAGVLNIWTCTEKLRKLKSNWGPVVASNAVAGRAER
jgi:hypothetical protein